jgi:hypothetical protein
MGNVSLRKNSLLEMIEFSKRFSEIDDLHIIAEHKKCLSEKGKNKACRMSGA